MSSKLGGFTLIEIMIVIALMIIIAGLGFEFLMKPALGLYADNTINDIIQYFNYVKGQNKALSSYNDSYGISFDNPQNDDPYYLMFKNNTATVVEKIPLPNNITYLNPVQGERIDLFFCKDPDSSLLCNESGAKICDEIFQIGLKTTFLNVSRNIFISTSSSDLCVPFVWKE